MGLESAPFTLKLSRLSVDSLRSFDIISLPQVFYERIGCFYVESKRLFKQQDPLLEIAKACSSEAFSRGLKYFALRNGNECLGDKNWPSVLPKLKALKGCLGGRGGQNVSDVYRLTSKEAFAP